MKKQYLLGFLLLLTSTIGMMPSSVFANEAIDNDGDGVPNNLDQCPNLLEDYDPQYGNNVDGCPADFVPWYDVDYDGIEDHVDNCPTVKETYMILQKELLILTVMVILISWTLVQTNQKLSMALMTKTVVPMIQ
jgi:hypothetical protein